MYKSPTVGHRNAIARNFTRQTMRSGARLTQQNIRQACCKHALNIHESPQTLCKQRSADKQFSALCFKRRFLKIRSWQPIRLNYM